MGAVPGHGMKGLGRRIEQIQRLVGHGRSRPQRWKLLAAGHFAPVGLLGDKRRIRSPAPSGRGGRRKAVGGGDRQISEPGVTPRLVSASPVRPVHSTNEIAVEPFTTAIDRIGHGDAECPREDVEGCLLPVSFGAIRDENPLSALMAQPRAWRNRLEDNAASRKQR